MSCALSYKEVPTRRQCMIRTKWTLAFIFAMACCLVLILTPVSGSAQGIGGTVKHGVKKGAGAVQKGVEGAAEETKKGAEAAGRGVKKAVTGKDEEGVTQERTTGTETTSRTRTRATAQNRRRESGEKNLPG